ncbi:unnamed protein product [Malus baccata var. baccata]
MNSTQTEMQEPSIDTDKLSYEIFSILESKFLFGYDDQKLWVPKQVSPSPTPVSDSKPDPVQLVGVQPQSENGVGAIKNQRGKICILSIDGGGGMRGILSGKALAYLEQALKQKSGNPDARIADYFDVATGAGVGGIFAAMLFATRDHARPIFKADDTWRFLSDHGKSLFNNNRSSSSASSPGFLRRLFRSSGSGSGSTGSATAGLEKVMKEAFADDDRTLTLRDTLKPVLIPCYDLSSRAPFLFSRADALETDSYDFRLWEVCRATSAEPVIFEPVQMQSVNNQTKCLAVDGGLAMSNPTAAAITHVLHNKQEFPFVRGVEDIMVLSIGSGQFLEEARYEYEQVKKWPDLVDQSVAMAFGQSGSSNYVRIQANGTSLGRCGPNVDTNPSPNNVKKLVGVAEEMLKQKNVESVLFGGKRIGEQSNFEKLDWFAGELVLEHQRRSCRIAPTVAFKQAAAKTT